MSLSVLVIDDAPEIRTIIRCIVDLHNQGWAVIGEASDGEQGVSAAHVNQPDLVLLDLAMPVMDGLEALPLVHDAAPNAVVVVLTGFPGDETRAAAFDAGADAYLEKDDLVSSLIPKLEHILRELRAHHHGPAAAPPDTDTAN